MSPPPAPSAGQHLFTPVFHPELRVLGRPNIHLFLRKRERYLPKIEDANKSGANITATDLLLSLIILDEFPGLNSINEVTEDHLLKLLAKKYEVQLETISLEDLEASVLSSVRVNLNEPDAVLRSISLFSDYTTLLRTKNWGTLIKTNTKLAVGHICKFLKPPALRSRIEDDLKVAKKDLKKQWADFYKHVISSAVECGKFVPAKSSYGSTKKPTKSTATERGGSSNPSRTTAAVPKPTSTAAKSSHRTVDKPVKELPVCLNVAKCKGKRFRKDCSVTTPDEFEVLIRSTTKPKRPKAISRSLAGLKQLLHLSR